MYELHYTIPRPQKQANFVCHPAECKKRLSRFCGTASPVYQRTIFIHWRLRRPWPPLLRGGCHAFGRDWGSLLGYDMLPPPQCAHWGTPLASAGGKRRFWNMQKYHFFDSRSECDYFALTLFICSLTICRISAGVSTGLEISFLGHTAAHRPQDVQTE